MQHRSKVQPRTVVTTAQTQFQCAAKERSGSLITTSQSQKRNSVTAKYLDFAIYVRYSLFGTPIASHTACGQYQSEY